MYLPIIFLSILVNLIVCRDFYVGMFKPNDFLVAQDRLYREKVYHSRVIAKYGRVFKCPITYLRIVDRLGMGQGPTVEILRGGLRRNFVVLRLQSVYNYPISVNIYVGCEKKIPKRAREQTVATTADPTGGGTGESEDTTTVTTASTDSFSNETTMVNNNTISDITTTSSTIADSNSTIANTTKLKL